MSDAAAAAPAAPAGGAPGTVPAQPGATPQPKPGETPTQAEARRLKLRLGDQEVELDESEVVANYRKGRDASKLVTVAEQKRREALKTKAEADGILSKLKDKGNLRTVLQELGYTREDLRKMSEAEILEAIEEEKLSPAERRAKDLERQLAERDKEKQQQKEEQERAAFEEEKARHQDEFSHLFLETMQATGLPKESGRFVAHRMALLYQQNEEMGLESSPEEMAAHVMAGLRSEHSGVLSGLKGPALVEWLGPDVVKEVLRTHLESIRTRRGGGAPQPRPAVQASPPAPANPRKGKWAEIEALLKD